jgi:hypothetical protein
LGDAASIESTGINNLKVSNCTFKDCATNVIYFETPTQCDFDNLDVDESVSTYTGGLVRLNRAKRCTIRNSRFKNTGKTAANFIRLVGEAVGNRVANNTFTEANVAVSLFASGGFTPSKTLISDNTYVDVTSKGGGGLSTTVRDSDAVEVVAGTASTIRAQSDLTDMNLDLAGKGTGVVRTGGAQVEVKGHVHTVAQVTGAAQWITTPPASATAPGTAGQLCHSGGFLYICVATNTWVWSKTTNTWPPA